MHLRSWVLLFGTALTAVAGGAGKLSTARPAATLTITLQFDDARYSNASVVYMEREFNRILAGSGVRVEWRHPGDPSLYTPASELVVARFRGACYAEPPSTSARRLTPGFTHVVDGTILPFPNVDCDQVRELIATAVAVGGPVRAQQLLGQAMARVLAHEVYHVLLKTTHHAGTGIARQALSGGELVRPVLDFEPAQALQIHEALAAQQLAGIE